MTAALSLLHRADGSASYSSNGCSVIAAVNGPIEVQRRDELPEEAALDVSVKPASGVGGINERHLESVIRNTLRQAILVSAHPRTLIQITLQIITTQENVSSYGGLSQATANLLILPALLQASILALLSTSIPLTMTFTAALIAVDSSNSLVKDPSPQDLKTASSIHVFAFSSHGELLVMESEGDFSWGVVEAVHEMASTLCHEQDTDDSDRGDVSMHSAEMSKLKDVVRDTVQAKMAKELKWKEELG